MPVYIAETSEATFTKDSGGLSGDGHFAIDCACKGKDGKYHGSHYGGTHDWERSILRNARSLATFEHTFYGRSSLLMMILEEHRESEGKPPLIIICNDCSRRFPFTFESYVNLPLRDMGAKDLCRGLECTQAQGVPQTAKIAEHKTKLK
jgi:hypothetical protein